MKELFSGILIFIIAVMAGCRHARTVAAVKVSDIGEFIETKNKYRVLRLNEAPFFGKYFMWEKMNPGRMLASFQPNVFSDDGIPLTLRRIDSQTDAFGDWTRIVSCMSGGILPTFETSHRHGIWAIEFGGGKTPKTTVEVCAHGGESFSMFMPWPILFFNWGCDPCFTDGRTYISHSYDPGFGCPIDSQTAVKALAYGIAVRLKDLEDSGEIDEYVVANARSIQALKDTAEGRGKYKAAELRKLGRIVDAQNVAEEESKVEVVTLDCEAGRDFAYRFVLQSRAGTSISLSDYNDIRSSFRNAIRSHYAANHPNLNPRSLVVDYPEWALGGGRITGKAVVLMISAESLSYNSSSRTGRIAVRIGANQFEEARRWIRKNIESIATGSNIKVEGDALPFGARFYTGRELIKENDMLEVEFKTE